MANIGIFYGSTTGNTESAVESIVELMGEDKVDMYDVSEATIADVNKYKYLVFAIPTWDIGELQEDWTDWIENLEDDSLELEGKKVAIFGVGDQEGYPDTFGDAMGIVYEKLEARKSHLVLDEWATESYNFEDSIGLRNGKFLGMMLDDDCQPEMTNERIQKWVDLANEVFT